LNSVTQKSLKSRFCGQTQVQFKRPSRFLSIYFLQASSVMSLISNPSPDTIVLCNSTDSFKFKGKCKYVTEILLFQNSLNLFSKATYLCDMIVLQCLLKQKSSYFKKTETRLMNGQTANIAAPYLSQCSLRLCYTCIYTAYKRCLC